MHFSLRQARGLAGAMVLSAGLSLAAVVLPAGASAAQVPASGGAAAHATGKYCVTVIKPLQERPVLLARLHALLLKPDQ